MKETLLGNFGSSRYCLGISTAVCDAPFSLSYMKGKTDMHKDIERKHNIYIDRERAAINRQ